MQTKLQLQLGNALKVSKTILVFSPAATHTGSQLKMNLVMEQQGLKYL